MIKTLRRKFIFFAMAAVTVLLLVLGLAINGMAWFMFERQTDIMLDTLVNSDGKFMKPGGSGEKKPKMPPPEMDIMRSARFFMVQADDSGTVLSADVDQIFYVNEEDAVSFAEKVIQKDSASGRIDRYKYAVKELDNGKLIFFLDLTRELLTMRTLIFVSAVIAFSSWLIVLLFVFLLSGKVVHPIIAGLEKQKQFITNAGHELKTPLAIIQSNNDAMSLIHGENRYNRNIKAQVTRLDELTANLLIQARIDEEAELTKEYLNISELVNDLLEPYEDVAQSRNIAFSSSVAPDIQFSANKQAFTQLITVLMDNAVKYTTDNGDIRFALARDARHIILTEENSCDPETNADPERLFERFYRADGARTQNDQCSGYGIGLSVARSICQSLGGKLTASYPSAGRIRFTAKF